MLGLDESKKLNQIQFMEPVTSINMITNNNNLKTGLNVIDT